MKNEQILKFNFDVSTFRLIGRELITDRITALVELVKNCYDANAEKVTIEFMNISKKSPNSKIIIADDGKGMSSADIKNKWMMIGTPDKRDNKNSGPPYNRICVGKKGVGRFAVDKLGSVLVLKTTRKADNTAFVLENNWGLFEKIEDEQSKQMQKTRKRHKGNENEFSVKKLFTDIENKYWEEEKTDQKHGTILEISHLHEIWTNADIARIYRELSKLISPYYKQQYTFNISIKAPDIKGYEEFKIINSFALEQAAAYNVDLIYDEKNNKQEALIFDKSKGLLKKKTIQRLSSGLLEVHLYYFDQDAKKKFRSVYEHDNIDGLRIYRDGILTTPFTENVDNPDEKKDILGIDKRRWSGFFDKISNRDLLGWIELSNDRNPCIIEATNRQGFVDNQAWKDLKGFVIEQISRIEEMLKYQKEKEKAGIIHGVVDSKNSIAMIKRILKDTSSNDKKVKNNFAQIRKELGKIQGVLNKSQSKIIETKKEKERVEELLFSLVSIQTFAGMLSHIVRTLIGKIKERVEFVYNRISEAKYQSLCKEYSMDIFNEVNSLDRSVEFLLRYSKESETLEDIDVAEIINNTVDGIYHDRIVAEKINFELICDSKIVIRYNRKAFEDILDNLISNSFKALSVIKENRNIKITITDKKDALIMHYSNNGHSILEKDKNRIFDVFYTTTAFQGGAGLGLYIVKTRLEAIKGSVAVIDSEFKPQGATFEIIIPYKRSAML
ncbi:MAG: ATP-binding protein [Treponema sp.]|jgi:signal transduction histidine kinase|nr:ATP-binding protein [Treponema sp.]